MRMLSGLMFLLATLSSLVTAVQEMPECAMPCLQSSLAEQDKCAITDTDCICNDTLLAAAMERCVLQSCTVINALAAKNVTQTMCGAPIRDDTHLTPIITGTSGGAALIGVIIRLWMSGTGFWVDDAMIVVALAATVPMVVLEFMMSGLGFGKDTWTLEPANIYLIARYTWATEICWFVSIGCTKLSFLFMYLRIFPDQRLRTIVYTLIGLGIFGTFTFTIIVTVTCLPITYIWTAWDGEHKGKCIDLNAFVWAHAVMDILFDCIIIGLPIPALVKLKMSRKKRALIVLMFSVGGIATIVSILRIPSLLTFSESAKTTWEYCPLAYWSVLSCFAGIFCSCMPAMRRYLASLIPGSLFSTQEEPSQTPYNNGTQSARPSTSNKLSSANKAGRMGLSGITRTVDTAATKVDEDELELVHMGNGRWRERGVEDGKWSEGNKSETTLSEIGRSSSPHCMPEVKSE